MVVHDVVGKKQNCDWKKTVLNSKNNEYKADLGLISDLVSGRGFFSCLIFNKSRPFNSSCTLGLPKNYSQKMFRTL